MSGIGPITGADPGGAAFPGSAAVGQRFFRTDLGMEFYWNGTLWLSTELHHERVVITLAAGVSVNTTDRTVPPCGVGVAIYFEKAVWRTTVATNNASNFWTMQLNVVNAAGSTTSAVGGHVYTDGDAASASAIYTHTINVNTVFAAVDAGKFEFFVSKALNPSNLIYAAGFSYRWTAI